MRNSNFGGPAAELQNLIEAPNIDTSMRSWAFERDEGEGGFKRCGPSPRLPDKALSFNTKAECEKNLANRLAREQKTDREMRNKDLLRYAAMIAWAGYGLKEGGAPGLVLGPAVNAPRGVKKAVGYGGLIGAALMANMVRKEPSGMGAGLGMIMASALAVVGGASLWSARK